MVKIGHREMKVSNAFSLPPVPSSWHRAAWTVECLTKSDRLWDCSPGLEPCTHHTLCHPLLDNVLCCLFIINAQPFK